MVDWHRGPSRGERKSASINPRKEPAPDDEPGFQIGGTKKAWGRRAPYPIFGTPGSWSGFRQRSPTKGSTTSVAEISPSNLSLWPEQLVSVIGGCLELS